MSKSLEKLESEFIKSFGQDSAAIGGLNKGLGAVSTGSLAFDYALGTGGWSIGYLHGVYGQRDIGKSSCVGLSAIRSAQEMGLVPAIVALEPNFDREWARKHGVNPDELFIVYPSDGEEAFTMLQRLLMSKNVDFVLFDSVGAVVSKDQMEKDDSKVRVGGASALISKGIQVAAPLAFRNDKCVILLNQERDVIGSRFPMKKQPGGNALEFFESTIVHLKNGKERFVVKEGELEIEIGRQIVAHIERNKLSEGSNKKVIFDFYSAEVEGYPFGIDQVSDILNTGKRTGVLTTRGAWIDLPNGHSENGAKATGEYLRENPEVVGQIRDLVLEHMLTHKSSKEVQTEDTTLKFELGKKAPVE